MKLLFVIDHFGSGGAQRQIVNLAIGMTNAGHKIKIFNYYPEYDFYRNLLIDNAVEIINCSKKKKGFSFGVLRELRKHLKSDKYDLALAYLDSPSIMLILSGLFSKSKIVVSDRSSYLGASSRFKYFMIRQLFRLADYIITNSETQKKWLIGKAYLSKEKVVKIYNGIDPCQFDPGIVIKKKPNELRLIAIGGIRPVKNIETLIFGLELFYKKHKWLPSITWVGQSDSLEYEREIIAILEHRPEIKHIWHWLGERNDIPDLLARHHALVLPSYYEGLPNVVCEALFSGKPVIASMVCDNPLLIEDKVRGFLFDPYNPGSIIDAIEKLNQLSNEQYMTMSKLNRSFAEDNLSCELMTDKYISLFNLIIK